jgi:predicted PurR-regulated permease PerM
VLGGTLTPFVAGLVLAYLLDPPVRRLERLRFGRVGATTLVIGLFVLLALAVLFFLLPFAVREIADLLLKLPEMVGRLQTAIFERGVPLLQRLGIGVPDLKAIQGSLDDPSRGGALALGALQTLWTQGLALIAFGSLLVVTTVVAFFLLLDWDAMIARIDGWLPRAHCDTIRRLALEMDAVVSAFLRGQALICLMLGLYYAVALSLIGLNSGFVIGLLAGLLCFIPYLGSIGGLLVAVVVAFAQFWPSWEMVAAVIAVFLVGQFVEGNIVQPKLMGRAVGLHPVWIMFALVAFGSVAGLLGLLIAVPAAAVIGVLARHGLTLYLTSPLYHNETEPEPAARERIDA